MTTGYIKTARGIELRSSKRKILEFNVPAGNYLVYAKANLAIGAQASFDGYFDLALELEKAVDVTGGHLISSQIWTGGAYVGGADQETVALSLGASVSGKTNKISLSGIGWPDDLVRISGIVVSAIGVDELNSAWIYNWPSVGEIKSAVSRPPKYVNYRESFLPELNAA